MNIPHVAYVSQYQKYDGETCDPLNKNSIACVKCGQYDGGRRCMFV